MVDVLSALRVPLQPVRIVNPAGMSPVVLICDHASNSIPPEYGTLGLPEAELTRHIAWDPGAAEVARAMSAQLDATLVESGVSRLVIDCNRSLDAPDLIPAVSETTIVPGNASVGSVERKRRIALAYDPFHAALADLVEQRRDSGHRVCLVSVHSFTPVYKDIARPWHVGVVHDGDPWPAQPMMAALRSRPHLVVGDNEPYSPADRVYFTLERHGRAHGLPCAMIEIRNDLIADDGGRREWAGLLSDIITELLAEKGRQEPSRRETEPPVLPAN